MHKYIKNYIIMWSSKEFLKKDKSTFEHYCKMYINNLRDLYIELDEYEHKTMN